ncbi:MAG: GntR family transcriptional regulator [Firmicutes bacterium]|nr:GntR family transcriptional regulator [Bacillota bacterium]
MSWEFDAQRPIYTQLVEELILRMVTGCYAPGSRLPSVRELAGEARVNPNTVQRAMADLEARGLIRTERTSGRFVTEDLALLEQEKQQVAQGHVDNFLSRMAQLGYTAEQAVSLAARKGVDKT